VLCDRALIVQQDTTIAVIIICKNIFTLLSRKLIGNAPLLINNTKNEPLKIHKALNENIMAKKKTGKGLT